MLEDMILNGSLTDLEVTARRSHLFSVGRDDGMVAVESRSVEELVAILRDPYLERVVLRVPVEGDYQTAQTARRHSDMGDDFNSLIDAPTEDVTKLLGDSKGGSLRSLP